MDRDYIAPQLTWRETIVAGTYVVLDVFLILFVIAIPTLAANLFSPTFPKKWKLGNALALLFILALVGAIVALVVMLT
jgi:hypothetical protein